MAVIDDQPDDYEYVGADAMRGMGGKEERRGGVGATMMAKMITPFLPSSRSFVGRNDMMVPSLSLSAKEKEKDNSLLSFCTVPLPAEYREGEETEGEEGRQKLYVHLKKSEEQVRASV